jgi:hypothetical protein
MQDPNQVHIDSALTTLSIQYKNNNLIAELIAKPLSVLKKSDKYFVYGKESFKVPETLRMDGAESNEVHMTYSQDSYYCQEHSLRDIVTDNVRKNADKPLSPDLDTTEMLTNLILLDLEVKVATAMRDTSKYTNSNYTTLSGTSQWSDYTNSTPLTNIKSAKAIIRKLIGREANTILLPGDVAEVLSLHPDIKDLRKYTDPNLLTDAGLPPKILGLKVIEAKATKNVAYQGATESLSYVWGTDAIIMYVPERVTPKMLAPWIILRESGFRLTSKWREEKRKGDMIEVSDSYDVKEVADQCAYLIVNAIA